MLNIKNSKDLLEIQSEGALGIADFETLGKEADKLIKEYGNIRLLIDVREFSGWESLSASEAHFSFIKNHHHNVIKVAVVIGKFWEAWIAVLVRTFLQPEIKVFQSTETDAAKSWINEK